MKPIRALIKAIGESALLLVLVYLLYYGVQEVIGRPPAFIPVPAWGAVVPRAAPDSFATIVDSVKAVVVNINTTHAEGGQGPQAVDLPREFFERYFGEGLLGDEPRESLGSGLILEPDGYILTSNHVIENARLIMVRLSDDEEYEARVVGRDPHTDLALLKIQVSRKLPAARLGDSERLRVGDWVLAVGNPFGLEQTVTAGIVSAKGRVLGGSPYEDFIQTDAAINLGNSGGPLFNTRGEVVGINTTILSQTGGSVGIGFAVPINLAKELIPQLKAKGRVSRGWLGVDIAPVPAELAAKLGRSARYGALVTEIIPDGPAARSGLRAGDVIVAFQGKPIRRAYELPRLSAKASVGSEVEVKILRDSGELTVKVKLGELPEPP